MILAGGIIEISWELKLGWESFSVQVPPGLSPLNVVLSCGEVSLSALWCMPTVAYFVRAHNYINHEGAIVTQMPA